jgi:hypothetical protein
MAAAFADLERTVGRSSGPSAEVRLAMGWPDGADGRALVRGLREALLERVA